MKINKFLAIFLISIIAFTETPKALVKSDVYKQGIYDISEANPFRATAKLVKANGGITSLSIVDSTGNQKFYNRFDTENESINLGVINDADLIAIVGKGEIAIIFSK
jgi:hypothetical protein